MKMKKDKKKEDKIDEARSSGGPLMGGLPPSPHHIPDLELFFGIFQSKNIASVMKMRTVVR